MTTASIYYNQRTGEPDYILIDGVRADVANTFEHADSVHDDRVRAVNAACLTLGWQAMAHAPIVRQADGRGTIRIEPCPSHPAPPAAATDDVSRTAYISRSATNGTLTTIHVGTDSAPLPPHLAPFDGWDLDPGMLAAIERTLLDRLAHRRVGDIAPNGYGYRCTVVPAVATDYEDWRQVPTLVRVTDEAATALNTATLTLGIPADELASAWIVTAAANAIRTHARFTSDGYILDPARIKGWAPEGHPHLDTLPTKG